MIKKVYIGIMQRRYEDKRKEDRMIKCFRCEKEIKKEIVYLLVILLISLVLVSGCVEEVPTKGDKTIQKTETPEATQTKLELKLGEVAKTSKMEVVVISAEKTVSYYNSLWEEDVEAEKGKLFVIVETELKNVGSDVEYADPDDFSMSDSEGFKYDPEGGFLGADIENALKYTKLLPGERIAGKLVFEVPETVTGLKVKYNFGGIFGKPIIASWTLS